MSVAIVKIIFFSRRLSLLDLRFFVKKVIYINYIDTINIFMINLLINIIYSNIKIVSFSS